MLELLLALSAAAVVDPKGTPTPTTPQITSFGEPNLNDCVHAMAGIAWNSCDRDVDVFVYEDKKFKSPPYRLARGGQRNDVPAGTRYHLIACAAGLQPVDAATGAFLDKTVARSRCAVPAKHSNTK